MGSPHPPLDYFQDFTFFPLPLLALCLLAIHLLTLYIPLNLADTSSPAASPPPSAVEKEDKPVASLLSRIGGLSTDAEPFTPSSPSGASKDHSQSTTQRPKPNLSNPLFGKALAGISAPKKVPEASQPPQKEGKVDSTPVPAAGLSIKSSASSSQRGQELLGSEPSTQGKMTTDGEHSHFPTTGTV